MKIKNANIYITQLLLKKPFSHGSFTRKHNDTTFIELKSKGKVGYGETLPRDYVTGETPKQVLDNLDKYLSKMPKEFKTLEEISNFLYEIENKGSRNMAALCGLDMALLDLYCKSKDKSLLDILCNELDYKKTNEPRVTSGPLGLTTPNWKKDFYCLAGISDIKLKITPESDPEKIRRLSKGILKPKTFRLDGNCSFTQEQLAGLLINAKVNPDYIEQPFPVGVEKQWPGVKFLADESLVSLSDAETINFNAASIRIGKNGGILRTLDLIKEWEKRGKQYMLGSLIGETSLLSSALLHISSITNPFLIEGCYSNRLLKSDPTDIHPSVSYMGKVKFNFTIPGIGTNLTLFEDQTKKIKIF